MVSLHKRLVQYLPEPTFSSCLIVFGCSIVTDFKSKMFEFSINFGFQVITFIISPIFVLSQQI